MKSPLTSAALLVGRLGSSLRALTLTALLLGGALSTQATIRYVKPTASGSGDGSSWANASADLQAMINASSAGDQVWVAAGTYKPTTTTNRSISFSLKNGVAVYGGFNGTETLLSQRNWVVNVTILSGDIGTPGDDSDNSYHVVYNSGVNSTAVLDGFTITKGQAYPVFGNTSGGGMYNNYSSPTLTNCSFTENTANEGGGMYNTHSSPTLTNCSFSENAGYSIGGGMYNTHSSPTLTNCSFSGNTAYNGGGGMYNNHSSPTLTNCSFSENAATFGGGGIANLSSSPTLMNCSFSGNTTNGIQNVISSSPTLTNCILWGNGTGTEIFNATGSSPTVTYSIVKGGYAGTGNLNADPLFVNPPTDLHLQLSSPAINAGTSAGAPAFDFEGDSRPQGIKFDMGVDEVPCSGTPAALCQNYTAALDASGTATISADDVDAGSTVPCGIPSRTVSPNTFNCSHIGTQTVVLTVTDVNNASSSCTATVTVQDNLPPAATCPATTNVACAAQVPPPNPAAVTATDNCGGSVTVTLLATTTSDSACVNQKNITRVYKATDAHNNSSTCSHLIAVYDNTPPNFTSAPPNLTVQCNSVPPPATLAATDNCGAPVTVSYNGQTTTPGPCTDAYTITRTWTATDNCNNTKTISQTISVVDTQKPNFTSAPPNLTVQCNAIPPVATPTATDNCDPVVAITYNGQTTSPGSCPNQYTITRIWTAADNCNNTRTVSQRISVIDTQKPFFTSVPPNLSIACTDPMPPLGTPTASDHCGSASVLYLGQTTLNTQCPGTYQVRRTWRATDACGNSTTASQTIFVSDAQPPTFTSVPPNTTIHCTDPLPPLGNPTATDNCSPYVHITFLGSTPSGSGCSTTYTITRTWKADDLCGNSATATQLITVLATPLHQPNAERANDHANAANGYLNAFPNPTTGTLWIACAVPNPPAHLRLFNAQGQLLWERHLDEPDTHQLISIPLREIGAAAGHYTLQLHGDRHTATQRIVLIDQP
jgi:hypothetical protein